MLSIAGIGSRKTPKSILNQMAQIGLWCKTNQITVRSGHAPGADQSFETADEYCVAYLPWTGFEADFVSKAKLVVYKPNHETEMIARRYHPAYDGLKFGVKKLMCRNVWQVLGPTLSDPVKAVVCFTEGAKGGGGTGQALRIAKAYSIPILDMGGSEFDTADKIIAKLKTILEM